MLFTPGRKDPVPRQGTADRAKDILINVYISFGIISSRAFKKETIFKLTKSHAAAWTEAFGFLRVRYHIRFIAQSPI
jgi:hypothetical protein